MLQIQCKFCKHSMRWFRVVEYAGKKFVCCEWCHFLLLSLHPSIALPQCCECGIMLEESPFKGKIFTKPDGTPDLSVGYSHGMCASCAARKLATHRRQRQVRALREAIAIEEALAMPVLQAV